MAISFESALGVLPRNLLLRTQRAEILASNIVNADTPNYKARDIDFKSILNGVKQGSGAMGLEVTQSGHQAGVISLAFQASYTFLNKTMKGLMAAIKGE